MLPRRPLTASLVALASIAFVTVALLAGCAGAAPTHPSPSSTGGIATLATDAPDAADPNAALFAKYGAPVQLRLDMSDEDVARAYVPSQRCANDVSTAGWKSVHSIEQVEKLKALTAETCDPLVPEAPPEYQHGNPDARRFVETVVDCLTQNGFPDASIGTDPRGDYYPTSPGDGARLGAVIRECETSASAP